MYKVSPENIPYASEYLTALRELETYYKTGKESVVLAKGGCPLCVVPRRLYGIHDCSPCPWVTLLGYPCNQVYRATTIIKDEGLSVGQLRVHRVPSWKQYRLRQLRKWIPLYEEAALLAKDKTATE